MRVAYGIKAANPRALSWTRVHFFNGRKTCTTVSPVLRLQQQRRSYVSRGKSTVGADSIIDHAAAVDNGSLHDQSPVQISDTTSAPTTLPKKRGRKPRLPATDTPNTSSITTAQSKAKPPLPSPSPPPPPPRVNPGLSQHHSDLPSFLSHASRSALDPTSKVYLGTHYEYLVAASLAPLGFTLTRVGGTSDLGIDLIGHWAVPAGPARPPQQQHPLPVIIQCKAAAPRAVMMRELGGALASAPVGWRGDSVVTLLVASKAATKGVREAIARSALPMGFLCIEAGEGHVRQFVWNQAAVLKCGLEGVGVALSYPEEHVVLTWQGEPCSPVLQKTS